MYEKYENVWEALENSWEMPQFTSYGQFIIFGLVAVMAVYFVLTRFTKFKKYFTLKSYIFSTLLGITAGVGVNAAFLAFITSVSQEMHLKYPYEIRGHGIVLAITCMVFLVFCFFYFAHRSKNPSGRGVFFDVIYALVLLPGASTVYYFLFSFVETAYNFYK